MKTSTAEGSLFQAYSAELNTAGNEAIAELEACTAELNRRPVQLNKGTL
jgi:hypothetical protein